MTTNDEPIAETAEQRTGYGLCRCATCGEVGRCTPHTDYFGRADGRLDCEKCVMGTGVTHDAIVNPRCTICRGVGRVPPGTPGASERFKGDDGMLVCGCVVIHEVAVAGQRPAKGGAR